MNTLKTIQEQLNAAARGEITNADALTNIQRAISLHRLNKRIARLKRRLETDGIDVDAMLAQLEAKRHAL